MNKRGAREVVPRSEEISEAYHLGDVRSLKGEVRRPRRGRVRRLNYQEVHGALFPEADS